MREITIFTVEQMLPTMNALLYLVAGAMLYKWGASK
jgi:hypothetical protein